MEEGSRTCAPCSGSRSRSGPRHKWPSILLAFATTPMVQADGFWDRSVHAPGIASTLLGVIHSLFLAQRRHLLQFEERERARHAAVAP